MEGYHSIENQAIQLAPMVAFQTIHTMSMHCALCSAAILLKNRQTEESSHILPTIKLYHTEIF